jgi:cytochrome P450
MAQKRTPPGPPGHWLWGNVPEFRADMLGFYTRVAREFGDVAGYRLGPRRSVLVSRPDLIEQVLVTDNRKFIKNFGTRLLRPTLGNGLLLSEGDSWLKQRRLIQPLFSRQRIDSYGDMIVAATVRQIESWTAEPQRDLHADMMQLTLNVVTQVLLGAGSEANSQAVNAAAVAIQGDFNSRFQASFPVPFWLPHPRNWRLRKQVQRLDTILQAVIDERRSRPSGHDDLLTRLIQARDEGDQTGMTDRQLRDEMMTIFLAGHETTANALAWTWHLLMRHPQVAARAVQEIETVLAGRLPTAAEVPQLAFVEQVLLESMRLYPPAYVIGREALEDIEIDGYHVSAGTSVMMSQWVMHHDPRYFSDPDAFLPERWSDNEFRKQIRHAYFPFGGGPRVCIGNTFAIVEAVLILATILPRFQLAPIGENRPIPPVVAVTLRPRDGVPALATRRGVKTTH